MTPQQMIKAIRALEERCSRLEHALNFMAAPKAKRPYNRKTPNAAMAPEPECLNQNSLTTT